MRRFLRLLTGVVIVLALAVCLPLTALRFVENLRPTVLAATAVSPYAVIGYVVALVLCLTLVRGARRRVLPAAAALLSGALLISHLVWLRPWVADGDPPKTGDLVVMSANLRFGEGDPATVLRTVKGEGVEVLVLQEVTPDALARLQQAGLRKQLPYVAGRAVVGVKGTMVFSTYPLDDQQPLSVDLSGFTIRVAAKVPFRLYAVHVAQLLVSPQPWHDDLVMLRQRLEEDADREPVLAAGDFNATYSHVPMRRLLDTGMRDAAEQSGTWSPTWPTSDRESWLRPLFAIDHVLISDGFEAVTTWTQKIPRSDHRAVLAQLAFRAPPGEDSQ